MQSDFEGTYLQYVGELVKMLNEQKLKNIGKHNKDWETFDFKGYLTNSVKRYRIVNELIQRHSNAQKGSILDIGGFFAAFPLTMKKLGYDVSISEKLEFYDTAFDDVINLIKESRVGIIDLDFVEETCTLQKRYDTITCLAVLEHLAHSPKRLMENMKYVLADDGILILEVPNMAAFGKRIKFLLHGTGVLPDISVIYNSAVPFIGHHHEYTIDEIRTLADISGFEVLEVKTANYSFEDTLLNRIKYFPQYHLSSARELIYACLRKAR